MFIVVIMCWIASASDDRTWVYLERATTAKTAVEQAKQESGLLDEQITEVVVVPADTSNLGLIYAG